MIRSGYEFFKYTNMLSSFLGWVVGNIEWDVFFFIIVSLPVMFFGCIKTTYELLRNNRYGNGAGKGQHRADRFINIYYSNAHSRIRYSVREPEGASGNDFYIFVKVVDDDLIARKLVSRDENGLLSVLRTDIRSRVRSRVIAFFITQYLIAFTSDTRAYYKELRSHRRMAPV